MAVIKYLLILFFCQLIKTKSYAQDLRITLSIDWDTTPVYIRYFDSIQKTGIPQLLITYENLSGRDIYFKKIVGENALLPINSMAGVFVVTHIIASIKEGNEQITFKTQSSSQVYDVDLSIPNKFYSNDFVYDTEIYLRKKEKRISDISIEIDIELLNDILAKQIFLNRNNSGKQLLFFNYPGKETLPYSMVSTAMALAEPSRKSIKVAMEKDSSVFPVEQYKSAFCFLKNNEKYIEKVNLLPLMLIGGTYNFTFKNQMPEDYLNVYPADLFPAKSIKMKLPTHIGVYSLYTGKFKTDALLVTFEGKNEKSYVTIGQK